MKKLTTEEFIRKAREVHGDKYDYSKVEYVNSQTKVCIICPIHGEFWQRPNAHLRGQGCKKCANGLVYGKGLNDSSEFVNNDRIIKQSYGTWHHMLRRCYNPDEKMVSYEGCSVCEEWLLFSNFEKWFDENYVEGYQLDKDIVGGKGNKIYSPRTCCFVPQEINLLLVNRKNHRGEFPVGVCRQSRSDNFMVRLFENGKGKYVGTYNSKEDAFAAYKQAKESHIKEVAQKYYNDGKITKRVYDALVKYEVEITD